MVFEFNIIVPSSVFIDIAYNDNIWLQFLFNIEEKSIHQNCLYIDLYLIFNASSVQRLLNTWFVWHTFWIIKSTTLRFSNYNDICNGLLSFLPSFQYNWLIGYNIPFKYMGEHKSFAVLNSIGIKHWRVEMTTAILSFHITYKI